MPDHASILELVILGAGPAGLSMAVEGIRGGIDSSKVLILEKAPEHSWSIRKFYPDDKLVTANYKGQAADCAGEMCIPDLTKDETLAYFDEKIAKHKLRIHCNEEVSSIGPDGRGNFIIETSKNSYVSKSCAIAIGVFGRPNKPSYDLPSALRSRIHFDVTSAPVSNLKILVVGGGDSASEYCQLLASRCNKVTISYRKTEFTRMNDANLSKLNDLVDSQKMQQILNSNILRLDEDENQVQVQFLNPKGKVESYDHVFYALGGTTPQNFLKTIGIDFKGSSPEFDKNYETNVPGLFLVGDLTAGNKGGSIISAFNSGHEAMREVCRSYLDCKL